jgi:hypothetical protein
LAFDGTVELTETLIVTTNTVLDASGHAVSINGNHQIRHLVVTNNASLRLIALELLNGLHQGSQGEVGQPGNPGLGGSIYVVGGSLELQRCTLLNSRSQGGDGGPAVMFAGAGTGTIAGTGYGGAIYGVDCQVELDD